MNLLDTLREAAWQCAENKPLLASSIIRAAIEAIEKAEPVGMCYRKSDGTLGTLCRGDMRMDVFPVFTHPAPVVPVGWQLVPIEPTVNMREVYTDDYVDSLIALVRLQHQAICGYALTIANNQCVDYHVCCGVATDLPHTDGCEACVALAAFNAVEKGEVK